MNPPRPTLSTLMFSVVVVAVGIAALQHPTEWDATAPYIATEGYKQAVATLSIGLVGVAATRSHKRLFWFGLLALGLGYVVHTLRWGNPIELVLSNLSMADKSPRYAGRFRQAAILLTASLVAVLGYVLVRPGNRKLVETEQRGTTP